MKHKINYLLVLLVVATGCNLKKEATGSVYFSSPESGAQVNSDESVKIQLEFPDGTSADSVVYFVDEQRLASVKDTQLVILPTSGLKMGNRLISAKVFRPGDTLEINTSVLIKPAKAPLKQTYKVEAVFPHDTSSYTQGLEFHDGIFYESDGEYASSTVRKVELSTGRVLKKVELPDDYFAEGLTVVDNKIILLTWQENMGFVLNKSSLEMIEDFPYQNSRVGWGLCYDGKKLYKSDGSNLIYFLNSKTYREEGFIEVYDNKGPVDQLNELEFIDGSIYANVYQTDRIVIIDPKTGAVTGEINLSGLLPAKDRLANTDVLNGIAYDPASRRLWVTGKKWDKLFQIKLINQ